MAPTENNQCLKISENFSVKFLPAALVFVCPCMVVRLQYGWTLPAETPSPHPTENFQLRYCPWPDIVCSTPAAHKKFNLDTIHGTLGRTLSVEPKAGHYRWYPTPPAHKKLSTHTLSAEPLAAHCPQSAPPPHTENIQLGHFLWYPWPLR